MHLTKEDMARVIVTALLCLKNLAPPDHREVKRLTRRSRKNLTALHKNAVQVIEQNRSKFL
jgi:predicted nuclease with RNAse H fold